MFKLLQAVTLQSYAQYSELGKPAGVDFKLT